MLFAAIEAIPQHYETLGVVSIMVPIADNRNPFGNWDPLPLDAALAALDKGHESLGEKASKLGGDGVIGIRYTPISDTMLLVTSTAIRFRYINA